MSRVDDLQKKYPSIPRHIILKKDLGAHGMRDNGDLDAYGQWVRLAGTGTYANYDYDVTLKDWADARPGRTKDGYVLRPGQFIHRNGFLATAGLNTKSDLQIRPEGNGKFAIYQGDERVEEVYYVPPKTKEEPLTSSGTPVSNLITWRKKYCFLIMPVRHCEYFPLGVACKFCNFNATQEEAKSIGLNRSTTINLEETIEAYKAYASEVRLVEGRFELGGFTKNENEARIHASFIERASAATSYKPNFIIHTQPTERKQMQRLKDAGLESLSFQMEIWDPELFPEAVPGKSQYTGRERYLEAFEEAVDVFGQGNVAIVLVGGLSMIPENGHKTWQEARDSTIDAMTWATKRGIFTHMTYLRLPPGSAYGDDENRKKCPPTEYYLETLLAQHQLSKEYGLYDKLNKLMWCPLDCLDDVEELAAIEQYGGLAGWASTCVPRQANWYLDWEEQFKSLATVGSDRSC